MQVQASWRGRRATRGDVGVEVAGQQQRLEEDHAGVPHRRRAAQPRQHQLGEHRLDEEQQARRRRKWWWRRVEPRWSRPVRRSESAANAGAGQ